MKKMLVGSTTAVLVAAAGVGTPHYLGTQAKQSLEIQHRILAETFLFEVVSHEYEQGWLESTEKTVLRFHPQVLSNLGKQLPDNLRAVLSKPITMINHVHHHPFADGAKPVRAVVETEFVYDDEVQKTLARFFGEQKPLRIRNVIALDGSGAMEIQIAPFEYEELSGIKLDWRGLSGQVKYANAFAHYTTEFKAPLFKAVLADKGSLQLENWQLVSESYSASNPQIALGSSQTQLARAEFVWKDKVNYNLKINELINMVSDLQIGAFINPNGSIAPSKIEVGKLAFSTKTGESGSFINSEGQFRFDTLVYGDEKYGPLDIHIAAEHLDASALTVLKRKFAQISAKKMTEEQIRNDLITAVKGEASGLFTHDPMLNIKTFRFTLPQGRIDVGGKIMFKDMKKEDLNQLGLMLKKTEADIRMSIPQKMLEDLAVSQAGNIFSVNAEDEAEARASIADINETLRLMVDSTVQSMAREKYLTLDGNQIDTVISLKNNALKLNGKTLQNEPDPDFDEGDMVSGQPH